MTDFERAFQITLSAEGSFTNNPNDPGNWTGGAVNAGDLKGTKFGISAASYPHLDIENLTVQAAQDIYEENYWIHVHCEDLPWPLCAVVFDCAVNLGVGRTPILLGPVIQDVQAHACLTTDGVVGPATKAALAKPGVAVSAAKEFVARRMEYMGDLPGWHVFGLGWSRRLVEQAIVASGA